MHNAGFRSVGVEDGPCEAGDMEGVIGGRTGVWGAEAWRDKAAVPTLGQVGAKGPLQRVDMWFYFFIVHAHTCKKFMLNLLLIPLLNHGLSLCRATW